MLVLGVSLVLIAAAVFSLAFGDKFIVVRRSAVGGELGLGEES